MKLEIVRFDRLQKFADGTTSSEAQAAYHGPIEFDAEEQTITVGGVSFPMSTVSSFVRVACDPCPECQQQFSNPTATAAHRRFAHGIQGKTRKA